MPERTVEKYRKRPVETRFYLDVEVQAEPPDRDGWAWATWPDGRRFKHWAAQLTTTPWGKPREESAALSSDHQGGRGELEKLRERKDDCGVCGVPGTNRREVCEGYSVPRCDDHRDFLAYQAESRLDTLLSDQPPASGMASNALGDLLKPRTWKVQCPDCHGRPTHVDGHWGADGSRPRVVWTCPTCKESGEVDVQLARETDHAG